MGEAMKYSAPVEAILPLMDRKNIRVMVNLTGGCGKGLEEVIRKFQAPHPDRFVTFTEPWWERTNQPGYSQFQADELVERDFRIAAWITVKQEVIGIGEFLTPLDPKLRIRSGRN
jgi:hypothetical protein